MGKLDGRVAIITGAARGQGEREARLFASEGAKVVVTDVLAEQGQRVAADIGGTFVRHDVTSEADWAAVVDAAKAAYGTIDILVNNAGIYRKGTLRNTTLEEYRFVVDVNQVGVFLGMQAVAPVMIEAKRGSIVNISSIAGMLGTPVSFAYGASKWAVRGMTKAAALDLGRFNIRVNSIHPGLIDTDMMTEVTGGEEDRFERMQRTVPLSGRMAKPEEIASVALFLASDDSSYATGAEFVIDGGVIAQ
ncbi:MAG: glucose 1-dehydrogenase [Acidimicrobiales bacterium]|nr:glucose 1-dehydrogenase [Acidimicrobiales bacterium]